MTAFDRFDPFERRITDAIDEIAGARESFKPFADAFGGLAAEDRTALLESLDAADVSGIDLDVGSAAEGSESPTNAATARLTMDMPQLSNLEPVTMSEVGTKLDLARAYMDMGDPDGARNILQEVLTEGSASQKQEARRLIDSLPGA